MKPKYTTEGLREKIIALGNPGSVSAVLAIYANEIIFLFTAQQQALIEDIEKRLPKKKVNIIDEGTATPEESKNPGLNQAVGFNRALNQVTETLEAIKKDLK